MGTMIGARFPDAMVKKIDAQVESGDYLSRADVLRDLVRDGLEKRGCDRGGTA